MAVSKRTRYEVLRRDNNTCRYCGETAPDVKITIDHVTPVALGGSDKPENLVAACKDCNAGKASVPPGAVLVEDVRQVDIRWAAAMRRAAEIKANERAEVEAYVRAFCATWDRWVPYDYERTLISLHASGLPVEEMRDAVRIADTARGVDNRFNYFCGVAWNKVTALQEMAKALLAVEEVAD